MKSKEHFILQRIRILAFFAGCLATGLFAKEMPSAAIESDKASGENVAPEDSENKERNNPVPANSGEEPKESGADKEKQSAPPLNNVPTESSSKEKEEAAIDAVKSSASANETKDSGTKTYLDIPLEELINTKISVSAASHVGENQRATPSIVSVITEKDIERNHCRDLVDVFNMIPGFNVTRDIGPISMTSRGLYGYEGRMLIMIDGMQLNELSWGTFSLGNELPVHLIDRIEVIRGPGSVLYGGLAELAVVNIITQKGKNLNGGKVSVRGGMLPSPTYGHIDAGIVYGSSYSNFEYSVLGSFSKARASDGKWNYFDWGKTFDQSESTAGIMSATANVSAKFFENTGMKILFHYYKYNYMDTIDPDPVYGDVDLQYLLSVSDEEYQKAMIHPVAFLTLGLEASHELKLSDNFQIVPTFQYQYSHPWDNTGTGYALKQTDSLGTHRPKLNLRGVLNWNNLEVTGGGEFYSDISYIQYRESGSNAGFRKELQDNPSESIAIWNMAAFLEVKFRALGLEDGNHMFNLVGGFRFDGNEIYGNQFNPRVGLTFVFENFHSKLIYSQAFRAPLVMNTAYSAYGMDPTKSWREPVVPEKTQVAEIEIGYKITENLLISANSFYQKVDRIMELRFNVGEADFFSDNGGTIATWGVEGEVRFISGIYESLLNISFFQPYFFNDDGNPYVSVDQPRGGDTYIARVLDANGNTTLLDELMGSPAFKLYMNHGFEIRENIRVQFSLLYLSSRRGMSKWGDTKVFPEQLILGAGLIWKDFLARDLDAFVSIHDIQNKRINLVVPFYDSKYDALPYKGREISLSLKYRI